MPEVTTVAGTYVPAEVAAHAPPVDLADPATYLPPTPQQGADESPTE